MKVSAVLHGGLGDMYLQMMTPGKPFGFFPALHEAGHETVAVVESDRAGAFGLPAGCPSVSRVTTGRQEPGLEPAERLARRLGLAWREPTFNISPEAAATVEAITAPYVAVQISTSLATKLAPRTIDLFAKLAAAKVPYVIVGETLGKPRTEWHMHAEIVRRSAAFIGVLSCFNCVAQIAKKPTFLLVNRAIFEPVIYGLMAQNNVRIEPWNAGRKIDDIYNDAAAWALTHVEPREIVL